MTDTDVLDTAQPQDTQSHNRLSTPYTTGCRLFTPSLGVHSCFPPDGATRATNHRPRHDCVPHINRQAEISHKSLGFYMNAPNKKPGTFRAVLRCSRVWLFPRYSTPPRLVSSVCAFVCTKWICQWHLPCYLLRLYDPNQTLQKAE